MKSRLMVYLFICASTYGVFKDTAGDAGYIALNGRVINELETMSRELSRPKLRYCAKFCLRS
jgi:hypothetical protein